MSRIGRREFIGAAAVGACAACAGALEARYGWAEHLLGGSRPAAEPAPPGLGPHAREAMYYTAVAVGLDCQGCHSGVDEPGRVHYCHTEDHEALMVKCNLCPNECVISDGARSHCRVRENRGGVLYTVAYGNPCAVHVDPIEKKPFFHFCPTQFALSIATAGCNLRCQYCQNWQISQKRPEETVNTNAPPEAVAAAAVREGIPIIAYTYSEPIVFYEYMIDTARLSRQHGVKNVMISGGYINEAPLRELCRVLDGIKIDLKGFSRDFYRRVCEGERDYVLRTIETIANEDVHFELVNLVVPTLNDAEDDLRALADWVVEHVGPDVPIHFSRFMPMYKLRNLPATPIETLERAREIAQSAGLRFVYLGNVPGHEGENTYCPACGHLLIERSGFAVLSYHIVEGGCEFCGEPIPGVWGPVSLPEVPTEPGQTGPSDY
jgi:pyruvate formate lyase activating enzyme